MQNYFLQPIFIIFTRSAINSEHDCTLKMKFSKLNKNISKTVLELV